MSTTLYRRSYVINNEDVFMLNSKKRRHVSGGASSVENKNICNSEQSPGVENSKTNVEKVEKPHLRKVSKFLLLFIKKCYTS